MAENYIQLPTDASNTGKLVRTNQRVVGGSSVEEHFMIIQDYNNNFQSQVVSGPVSTATGLAVWAIQSGSYDVTNRVAGSIVDMPNVTVTATDLDIRDLDVASDSIETGSKVWVQNPVGISGINDIGSVVISSAPLLGISGAKLDDLAGSVGVTALPAELGSVVISSAPLIGVSGLKLDDLGVTSLPNVTINNPETIGSLGVQTVTGSVIVAGSIMIGSVSAIVESVYIQSGDNIAVTSMPTTTVTATNLDIRDLSSASDSVEIIGTSNIGSVVISSASLLGISGEIFTGGDIVGSTVISSSARLGVSGNVNVSATNLDIRDLSSAQDNVNVNNITTGSMRIVSQADTLRQIEGGSVMLQDTSGVPLFFEGGMIPGSIITMPTTTVSATNLDIRDLTSASDSISTIGSVRISAPPLGISGTIFTDGDITGSMSLQGIGSVIIKSAPLIGVSGLIFTDGNMTGSMAMQGIGSMVISSSNRIGVSGIVEVSSMPTTTVTASNLDIRDLTKASDNVAVSGTATIAGSAYVTGSINIANEITMQDAGSPCFKRGILTASGTYADAWKVGATGSKVEMHGFHISTNNPGYVRILRSGATHVAISDYNLNYASGVTIEKTFCTPIIPGGANIAVGFGATIAGSTLVTIYGREVK